ncbi:MAG: hypothetical protein ACI9H6_000323 [Patiriisocius sp.]|jgi:hypothetical protein
MDRTRVILTFEDHRWIGPKFLLPDKWFNEDGSRLTLVIKSSETHLQLINIAFTRQTHLSEVSTEEAPEIYKPAIRPSDHMITRLSSELAKNMLWNRYNNVAVDLPMGARESTK